MISEDDSAILHFNPFNWKLCLYIGWKITINSSINAEPMRTNSGCTNRIKSNCNDESKYNQSPEYCPLFQRKIQSTILIMTMQYAILMILQNKKALFFTNEKLLEYVDVIVQFSDNTHQNLHLFSFSHK